MDAPKPLNALLEKYRTRIRAPQKRIVEVFQHIAEQEIGVHIDTKYITYQVRDKNIFLTCPSLLKSEVSMKKRDILTRMKDILGERDAPQNII